MLAMIDVIKNTAPSYTQSQAGQRRKSFIASVRRRLISHVAQILIAVVAWGCMQFAFADGVPFKPGDIVIGIVNPSFTGQIYHYSPNGTLLDTFTLKRGYYFDDQGAFDANNNFYIPVSYNSPFYKGTEPGILEISHKGNVLREFNPFPANRAASGMVFDKEGDAYIGTYDSTATIPLIYKMAPSGALLETYPLPYAVQGSGHGQVVYEELEPDQCTLRYNGGYADAIHQIDVCTNTLLPDFSPGVTDPFGYTTPASLYDMHRLPNGNLLVGGESQVFEFDNSGAEVNDFEYPTSDVNLANLQYAGWVGLNPDDKTFWVYDTYADMFNQYDVQTGAKVSQFSPDIYYNPNTGGIAYESFLTVVPNPGKAALVDPVPDLLSTLNTTSQGNVDKTSAASLASKGTDVTGVSADGVTEVLVRIKAAAVGDQYTLTIMNGTSSDEYGVLRPVDGTQYSNSITTTAIDTPSGPMAFAIYKAPLDFARQGDKDDNAASRRIDIDANVNNETDTTIPVEIVRPPVILIHGVWSGGYTWGDFNESSAQSFASPPDPRFHIDTVNYFPTNADSFATNAPIVLSQVRGYVKNFKTNAQVAAVQADIVAHSMGGDIARTFAIQKDYQTIQNYNKGVIHKLITIDTPHAGSQFANNLYYYSSDFCKFVFGYFGQAVDGAVRDLSDGSAALTALSTQTTPIPTHTIVGIASDLQTTTVEQNYVSTYLNKVCTNLLPNGSFADVLGPSSDLIVPADSQSGAGLGFAGNAIPSTTTDGVVHSVDTVLFNAGPDALSRTVSGSDIVFGATQNPGVVVDLLNASVNGGSFGQMLP